MNFGKNPAICSWGSDLGFIRDEGVQFSDPR